MGATRLASGKDVAIYLVEFVSPSFLYPDARRVAPISGSVACLRWALEYVRILRFTGLLYIYKS